MQTIQKWQLKIASGYNKIIFSIKYLRGLVLFLWRRSLPDLKKFHLNAFPNVRLKDFSRLDLALKFSSELVLLVMAGMVALWNVYFFHQKDTYSDLSHAGRLVVKNPDINPKLYAKMSVINTVVLSQNSIVPHAQAEEYFSVSPENTYSEDATANLVFNNDTIVQPNPDSVAELLAKQIKVYQTQSGDSLKSIASQNGLNIDTLMWANKLTSTTIKPGWFLIIPPTNGVIHKASNNDTLPDIAKKYKVTVEKIIAYNGLENAEDINPGDIFIVPGGTIAAPVQKPAPKPSTDGKVKPQGSSIPNLGNGTGHIFPKGYCTWYVASKVHVPWGGNAKNWLSNARAMGYTITNEAIPGSIVVTTDNSRYGHVALVHSVNEKGFTVSEMNYEKFGKVNTRFISHSSKTIRGFIIP
ncbi:MAG: LysM peptidoglycan-binding domain-containing protein [Candidatus Doudnabacteria bacterium]|nr:LysM peptidoglycan-binding domain-containing protein [Candidatus Doudnabacteria bacterium]